MQFVFLGVSFHLYGFIVGTAAVVGLLLAEKKALEQGLSEREFWLVAAVAILGGVVGARLWHVGTDYQLYQENWLAALAVWRGGLSILGAVAGGSAALYLWLQWVGGQQTGRASKVLPKTNKKRDFLQFLDIAIFGLPVGQAIGRLGNWANHELFGLPSTLPWAITIPFEKRPAQFATNVTFHPLFAYEALVLVAFAVWVWWVLPRQQRQQKCWRVFFEIGSGTLFLLYLLYYSVIRFGLDFLRIDKTFVIVGLLGKNQAALLLIGLVAAYLLWKRVLKLCLKQV